MLLAAAAHAAAANAAAAANSFSSPSHDAMKFRKLSEKERMPSQIYPNLLEHGTRNIPSMPKLPENIIVSGKLEYAIVLLYNVYLKLIQSINPYISIIYWIGASAPGTYPQNSLSGPANLQQQLPGHGTSAGFCNICHKFVSNRTNHKYVHSQVRLLVIHGVSFVLFWFEDDWFNLDYKYNDDDIDRKKVLGFNIVADFIAWFMPSLVFICDWP